MSLKKVGKFLAGTAAIGAAIGGILYVCKKKHLLDDFHDFDDDFDDEFEDDFDDSEEDTSAPAKEDEKPAREYVSIQLDSADKADDTDTTADTTATEEKNEESSDTEEETE